MANIKSQKKRILQNEKRRVRNKTVRTQLRTRVKQAEQAAATGADNLDEAHREAIKRLDKAVTKGIIHKNAANRKKSRLAKRVAQAKAEQS